MKFSSLFRPSLPALALVAITSSPLAHGQGSISPPGAPEPSMKTLDQVEARRPVDAQNTPGDATSEFVITAPGSYYLTSSVVTTKDNAIRSSAPGVTLDLNGYALVNAGGSAGSGVLLESNNVTIRNGRISGFKNGVDGLAANRMRVRDLTIDGLSGDAIVTGSQAHVEDCQIHNADGVGIAVGIVSLVRNCTVRTTGSHGISALETSIVEGNLLNNNNGDSILAANRCTIRNNICDFPPGSGAGIHLTSNQGESRVEDNNIVRRLVGIQIDGPDNHVSGNTVRQNGTNYQFAGGNFLNLLISEVPETIAWPCVATFAGTLNSTSGTAALTVASDGVTIDLGGHGLTSGSNTRPGIVCAGTAASPFSSLTVRNGSIRGFDSAVDLEQVRQVRLEGLDISGFSANGVEFLDVQGGHISKCTVRGAGSGIGIALNSSTFGIDGTGSLNVMVSESILTNLTYGVGLDEGTAGCVIRDNQFSYCSTRAFLASEFSVGNFIIRNTGFNARFQPGAGEGFGGTMGPEAVNSLQLDDVHPQNHPNANLSIR